MSINRLQRLHDAGVSIWLDTLSRELLDSGAFAELIAESAVTGATPNPTIFAKAITGSDRYDNQLRAAVACGVRDPRELFFELALDDVAPRRRLDRLRRLVLRLPPGHQGRRVAARRLRVARPDRSRQRTPCLDLPRRSMVGWLARLAMRPARGRSAPATPRARERRASRRSPGRPPSPRAPHEPAGRPAWA